MTPLRQRMVEDMRLRNLSANTQRAYLQQVSAFAKHFGRSPATLGPEEIRTWQLHLVEVRQLGRSSLVTATAALRFLYTVTLKRNVAVDDIVMSTKPRILPVILSREEVTAFLESIRSLKHRAILMTAYAAGLRVSEVVHLKATDIDSQRMVIRVNQGKNRKDRYVMLSPLLLEILRLYWHDAHPRDWLFPGDIPGHPITRSAVALACRIARQRSGIQKPITPHSLRHAFATHLLETGTDVRRIQLLMGHRSLSTTAKYLKVATSTICATSSPFDLLPHLEPVQPPPSPPDYF